MTGPLVALALIAGGIFAVFALAWVIAPTSLRRRPPAKHDPKILSADYGSGREGRTTVWSIPRDEQEYAKIWSDGRK